MSYLMSYFRVSRPALDYINNITATYSVLEKKFFLHILTSSLVSGNKSLYVPVSRDFLNEHFGKGFSPIKSKPVANNDILFFEHSYSEGLSREFCVRLDISSEFVRLCNANANQIVNVFSGKTVKPNASAIFEDKGKYPELILKALACMKPISLDAQAASNMLESLSQEKSKEFVVSQTARINQIMLSSIKENGMYVYKSQYSLSSTGRIFEVGGGIQGLSKQLRAAMLHNLSDVHNYDLEASQANGLLEEFAKANIRCEWLEKFVSDPTFKADVYARCGVSKAVFKKILYGVFYGSNLSKHSSVYSELWEHFEDSELCDAAIANAKNELKELINAIAKWHRALVSNPIKFANVKANGHIENACGRCIKRNEPANRIAAHILQGKESAFIYHLTILSKEYGYTVFSNQHDGLMTVGIIPEEAVEKARKSSGLKSVKLVEKKLDE